MVACWTCNQKIGGLNPVFENLSSRDFFSFSVSRYLILWDVYGTLLSGESLPK